MISNEFRLSSEPWGRQFWTQMNLNIILFLLACSWSCIFQGSLSVRRFLIFRLWVIQEQCYKPSTTLNSFSMLSHRAVFKLTMYWVMLAEDGIPEVERSAFEIDLFFKNIQWVPRKVLGVTGRKLNIERSLSARHQPSCLSQDHWTSGILQK